MRCKNCNLYPYQITNDVIDELMVYCGCCELCKLCRKKENIKSNNFCKYCSKKCKRCHKWMQRYNWPNDDIRDGFCYKCFHQCTSCLKFIPDQKAIYFQHKRFCEPCLQEYEKKINDEIQYRVVVKKLKYYGSTNEFVGWEKYKEFVNCESCKKQFWKHIRKKNKCKACKRKDKKLKTKDPSNKFFKYEFNKNNNKWELVKRAKICIDCFSVDWVNKNDDSTDCSNCKKVNRMNKKKYKKMKKNEINNLRIHK